MGLAGIPNLGGGHLAGNPNSDTCGGPAGAPRYYNTRQVSNPNLGRRSMAGILIGILVLSACTLRHSESRHFIHASVVHVSGAATQFKAVGLAGNPNLDHVGRRFLGIGVHMYP